MVGSQGENLAVTQNLCDALVHLRYPSKPRVFWIDAICVDQQNLMERSAQVQRMGEVYTLAHRVVVWLGPQDDSSTYAIELLEKLNSQIKVNMRNGTKSNSALSSSDLRYGSEPLSLSREEYAVLSSLFYRSWFERLWI
ncbi:hypothetical protein G7Y89_g3001 [Cudoniella acicularis]|uniref:Heterokaryon incompatibility domain-containing protein n=1 Tax=Cudoniella acicularis TaxID=354080 RepID=A0A8H4W836_9HELO|nr:hypothetical protein G7Y89_g3001 [Cudoniella acicularis]